MSRFGALARLPGMLKHVFYSTILVRDQAKALDFYTDVLGFQKRVDNPTPEGVRFLTVGVPGQEFMLVLWPGTPGKAQPVQGRVPAGVTIETDDCKATVEALRKRGVRFEGDVMEFPWGWVALFEDPDGNRIQVRQGK